MPEYNNQYGVSPSFDGATPSFNWGSFAAGIGGSVLGFGADMLKMSLQNRQQEKFYSEHQSPAARMREMLEAGINPNAAAQGISGSSAPNMTAASGDTGMPSTLASQLGNSVNNALSASQIQSEIDNTDADTRAKNIDNIFNLKTFEDRLKQVALQNDWTKAQTDQMLAFNKYADQLYYWNAQLAEQQVTNAKKQWDLYDAQIDNLQHQNEMYDAQTGEFKAGTAKLWKEVEFQKWYNHYCIENNIRPDSPEAEYIRQSLIAGSAPADSDEKKSAEQWIENFEKSQKDLSKSNAEGVATANNSFNPTQQLAIDYFNEYKAKDNSFQQLIDDYRAHGNYQKVKQLERERNKLRRKYRNKIRRINRGASLGGSAFGFGLNAGG